MKKILAFILALSMMLPLVACGNKTGGNQTNGSQAGSDSPYDQGTIRISTSGVDTGIDALSAKHFGELVEAETGGRIKVEVYPNSQLAGGDMAKLIELLIAGGNYEMIVGSGSVLGNIDERFLTHTIPFLFTSYDEAASYMDGTGGEFYAQMLADKGLLYVAGLYNGLRQLTTKDKVVTKPEDLKSLRIRVPSGEVYMKTLTEFGADPVAMNWSETFTALQQGTLDGHENGYQTISSANIQEVQKCITEWNWSFDGYWFVANQDMWNKYNEATQAMLMEKAKEAAQWGRDKLVADEVTIRKDFQDNYGVTITELTPEQHQVFVDAAQPAREYFIGKFGADVCAAWGLK